MTHEEILQLLYGETLVGNATELIEPRRETVPA
jgi:hypothetical protein